MIAGMVVRQEDLVSRGVVADHKALDPDELAEVMVDPVALVVFVVLLLQVHIPYYRSPQVVSAQGKHQAEAHRIVQDVPAALVVPCRQMCLTLLLLDRQVLVARQMSWFGFYLVAAHRRRCWRRLHRVVLKTMYHSSVGGENTGHHLEPSIAPSFSFI